MQKGGARWADSDRARAGTLFGLHPSRRRRGTIAGAQRAPADTVEAAAAWRENLPCPSLSLRQGAWAGPIQTVTVRSGQRPGRSAWFQVDALSPPDASRRPSQAVVDKQGATAGISEW
jgi:hypothetical protein